MTKKRAKRTVYKDDHDRYMGKVIFKHKLFQNIDRGLLMRFALYHKANTSIYSEFKTIAFAMIATGRKKYSGWIILNVIRWRKDKQSNDRIFKINNDYIALFSRMFVVEFPENEEFFVLRKMKDKSKISQEEKNRIEDESRLLS